MAKVEPLRERKPPETPAPKAKQVSLEADGLVQRYGGRAVVDQTANAVTLLGGVVARTAAGMTLHCDRLVYRQAGATLHGDGNVVITDPRGFWATGSSFDSDTSLTHMRMR